MLGLMILGLVWIVVTYLSQSQYPIPGIEQWNLAIGAALIIAGFAMTTRWH
jgi:VIT1/CCC1 family predicted Fe2+/Mn2+ transporter